MRNAYVIAHHSKISCYDVEFTGRVFQQPMYMHLVGVDNAATTPRNEARTLQCQITNLNMFVEPAKPGCSGGRSQ